MPTEPEDIIIPVIVDLRPKSPPSGQVIGVVRDLKPARGAIVWPPPPSDDEPDAA
jgi:hypothetical protein